jgi:sec-independent protein translocase protein TatC
MVDEPISFSLHLEELRKRLMIAGGSWLLAFFGCYSFAEPLFLYISEPLREAQEDKSDKKKGKRQH